MGNRSKKFVLIFYKLGTITRARAVILRVNLRRELFRLNYTQFLKVTSNL